MTATDSRHDVALTFRANIVLAVLNALTGVVLARLLGPTGRGELQAIQLWGLFLGTVSALGVPEAVVYFVARRRDEAGLVTGSALALTFLTSLVFTLVGWFTVPLLLNAQSAQVKDLARVFLLIIPVYVMIGTPMQALRGLNSFSKWNWLRILPSALWVLVVVGAWLAGPLQVSALAVGFMVVQGVVLAVVAVVAAPSIGRPFAIQPRRWPAMLRFGLPGVLGTVPQMLNLRLDQLLLAAFVDPERLGLYVAGVAWAGVLAPVLAALGSVIFPRLAGESSADERLRIMCKGIRVSAVIAAAAVTGVVLVTYPGMWVLFGSAYSSAVPAALVLVVAGGVLSVGTVVQEGFRGLGRPSEVLWSELAGLGVTAVSLLALLGPLNIMGAAIASLLGYSATLTILIVRLRLFAGVPIAADLRPRRQDVRDVAESTLRVVRRRRPSPG